MNMNSKTACVLVSALMIQSVVGQIVANLDADGICPCAAGPGVPGLTFGLSLSELSASNGGGLLVNSASPVPSTGLTVESNDMLIEGPLAVSGQLPFLGVVSLEGSMPATGSGAVTYECGDACKIGILSEGIEPAAPAYPAAQYPCAAGPGYAPIPAGYPAPAPCPYARR